MSLSEAEAEAEAAVHDRREKEDQTLYSAARAVNNINSQIA